MIRLTRLCWLWVVVLAIGGCTSKVGGHLSLKSQTPDGPVLTGSFDNALYALDGDGRAVILLLEGTGQRPVRAVMIRMFWRPRAGRTPIASTATNAMIHYVIFAGEHHGEVGVYSGAGFFFPDSKPGGPKLSGGLWEATMGLAEQTEGFEDLLGRSQLVGKVTVLRDDQNVWKLQRQIQERIRERLIEAG